MRYFNDYSFLFRDSSSGMNNMYSLLSEYNNIKSGTYAKVVKQYYAKAVEEKDSSEEKTTKKNNKKTQTVSEEEKALNKVQADAQSLTNAADALITRGTDSLFREKDITVKAEDGSETTQKGYDTDAIYKAVKKFADGYNSLMTSMGASGVKVMNGEECFAISGCGPSPMSALSMPSSVVYSQLVRQCLALTL